MNQIIMILLISMLILVHEIGHFIAARLCGIRVTRFGIGMPIGPSWKMFSIGYTDFYLHAFLFGGYVSFPDDEPESSEHSATALSERKRAAEVCEARDGGSDELSADRAKTVPESSELSAQIPENELYENKTIAQKLFVVSAGVIMNVVFAILLVIFAATYYHKLPGNTQDLYVNSFSEKTTSNIEQKGLLKNDKFEKVNNQKVDTLYQLTFFAQNSKLFDNYAQADLIDKNIAQLKELNPNLSETIKKDTVVILPAPMAENPLKVSKKALMGLEKYKKDGIELDKNQIELRDKIYNQKTYKTTSDISLNDLALALSDTYKPLSISVLRNGSEIVFDDIMVQKEGVLGVMLQVDDKYIETKTFKQIITKSFDYIYYTTKTMLLGLWQLFTGKISGSDMHGVIAIVKIGGDIIASKGMLNGILLTAMISINLAIMNFLPIPALDGGHVMFLVIEKLTGKKPTKEFAEKINSFFFFLLIILMVAICYNDIAALVTKKF